jgi:hypothetical protein
MMTMMAYLMLTLVGSSIVRDQSAEKAAKDMMAMEDRIMNKLGMIMDKIDAVAKNQVADTSAKAVTGGTGGGCQGSLECCKSGSKKCCMAGCLGDTESATGCTEASPTSCD